MQPRGIAHDPPRHRLAQHPATAAHQPAHRPLPGAGCGARRGHARDRRHRQAGVRVGLRPGLQHDRRRQGEPAAAGAQQRLPHQQADREHLLGLLPAVSARGRAARRRGWHVRRQHEDRGADLHGGLLPRVSCDRHQYGLFRQTHDRRRPAVCVLCRPELSQRRVFRRRARGDGGRQAGPQARRSVCSHARCRRRQGA